MRSMELSQFYVLWAVPWNPAMLLDLSLPGIGFSCYPLGDCIKDLVMLPKQIMALAWGLVSIPLKCIFMAIKAVLMAIGAWGPLAVSRAVRIRMRIYAHASYTHTHHIRTRIIYAHACTHARMHACTHARMHARTHAHDTHNHDCVVV